ncbi:hypothetical protein [Paenibacillus sp. SN-8-1]|uniref:hypothetical protein n=1 Tax=Paenibacillus sp. SN-8-1 TaxID=3435409 RepID=UPI003D9AB233
MRQTRILLFMALLISVITACSNKAQVQNNELFKHFSGELLSVVNQKDSKYSHNLGILYTVTIINTSPSMKEEYKEYNESNQTDAEFVVITDRTRIFRKIKDSTKQLITPEELELAKGNEMLSKGPKIEYWIRPMNKHLNDLEAIEITVMN